MRGYITHLLRAKSLKRKAKAQSHPNRLFLSHQPDPGGPGRRAINLPMCLAVTGASNPISISFNYHPLQQASVLFALKRNSCRIHGSWRVLSALLYGRTLTKIHFCSNTEPCDSDEQTVMETDPRRDCAA